MLQVNKTMKKDQAALDFDKSKFRGEASRGKLFPLRFKICGIRNAEMLAACIKYKVDFIGLNFVSSSRRKVTDNFLNYFSTQQIPHDKKIVGIFMNQSLLEIANTLQKESLDIIQLHGDESIEFCKQLKNTSPSIKIWKALSLKKSEKIEKHHQNIISYAKVVDLILFDGSDPGSGNRSDFNLLKELTQFCVTNNIPYGIAGGINAENIKEFVTQFPTAQLFDTASGVETDHKFSEKKLTLITSFLCKL